MSKALESIYKADIPYEKKRDLSTIVLALQANANDTFQQYVRLYEKIPSILSSPDTTDEHRRQWESLLISHRDKYLSYIKEIGEIEKDIALACEKYLPYI